MEVDASQSLTEKEKKKTPGFQIMIPWDWQQFARMGSDSNPFEVINMENREFKDVKNLYEDPISPFIYRKKSSNNDEFSISQAVHFQVRSESNGIFYYKLNFDTPSFLAFNLNRHGCWVIFPENLTLTRDSPKPISVEKD